MILIDIPKPKRCLYCPMIDYNHDACIAKPSHAGEERLSELEERPKWCPIIAECNIGELEVALKIYRKVKSEEENPEEGEEKK